MTLDVSIVLGLLILAMILFTTEWLSVDVTALGLVAALIGTGTLTPAQAFDGFGSEVIIILASIMILAGAIVKAGVMEWFGQLLHGVGKGNSRMSLMSLLAVSAGCSAVLSNTSTTALLLPAAVETARQGNFSASRVLMPLAFASMLGGAGTLIGTSANLASSGMVARLGLEPFTIFEFIGVGAAITLTGLFWLVVPGRYFLKERRHVDASHEHVPRGFVTTLYLPKGSGAADRAIEAIDFDALEADLLTVIRGGKRLSAHHSRKLRAGDELIVRTSRDGLLKLKKFADFTLEPDIHFSERHEGKSEPVMVEAVITPQSQFAGQSLKQIGFFDRYQGIVLAVFRHYQSRPARIENLQLRAGDLLLLQGTEQDMASLRSDPNVRVLSQIEEAVLTRREGVITLGAMGMAILLGTLDLLPLSLAFLLAVLFVVIAGNISMAEAYRFIEWRLLVLIAAMSSFGLAMEQSGAAAYLANHIVTLSEPFGPVAAMATFSLLTILLTQPMSNAAAALTMIPVAVSAAAGLGLDPRMLAILVTLSASLSFVSPLEPACLLVYDAGRYTFADYVRAGTPLTVICVTLLLILVPLIWP